MSSRKCDSTDVSVPASLAIRIILMLSSDYYLAKKKRASTLQIAQIFQTIWTGRWFNCRKAIIASGSVSLHPKRSHQTTGFFFFYISNVNLE